MLSSLKKNGLCSWNTHWKTLEQVSQQLWMSLNELAPIAPFTKLRFWYQITKLQSTTYIEAGIILEEMVNHTVMPRLLPDSRVVLLIQIWFPARKCSCSLGRQGRLIHGAFVHRRGLINKSSFSVEVPCWLSYSEWALILTALREAIHILRGRSNSIEKPEDAHCTCVYGHSC